MISNYAQEAQSRHGRKPCVHKSMPSRRVCCMQGAARQLQELLERELAWDLTVSDLQGETDDEDAPVIVEL